MTYKQEKRTNGMKGGNRTAEQGHNIFQQRRSGERVKLYCYRLQAEDLKYLEQIVKTGVEIVRFSETDLITEEDSAVLLATAADGQRLSPEQAPAGCPVFCWDGLKRYLLEKSWAEYCNAEQYYLHYALEKACKPTTEILLLGSSYAKYGLSATQLGAACVNLGLDAQDMYYTCRLGTRVIENNPGLRHIVLASGYYWFYSDISRADSAYARSLIADTYYPIFQDAHHAEWDPSTQRHIPLFDELAFLDEQRTFLSVCRIWYDTCRGESAKVTRNFALHPNGWNICNHYLHPSDRPVTPNEIPWRALPSSVKDAFARARCDGHNKLLRHVTSYAENKEILNRFISYCNQRNICVFILCMPQVDCYLRHLDPQFQQDYFAALDSVEGDYHFLDFHEAALFQDEDFIDQDHLSPSGATKATAILKELIDTCEK